MEYITPILYVIEVKKEDVITLSNVEIEDPNDVLPI